MQTQTFPNYNFYLNNPGFTIFCTAATLHGVNRSTLNCVGALDVKIKLGNKEHHETVYFCKDLDDIYLSLQACSGLKIAHDSFPCEINATFVSNVNNEKTQNGSIALSDGSKKPPEVDVDKIKVSLRRRTLPRIHLRPPRPPPELPTPPEP